MKLRSVCVVSSLLGAIGVAEAKPCERWNSSITKCQVVAAAVCNQPESTWTWGQRRNWYSWLYSDTADRACYKHVAKWFPGKEDLTQAIVVGPGVAVCLYDWDDDGHIYGYRGAPPVGRAANDYDHTHTTLSTYNMQTEPECDLVPNGPYAMDVANPSPPVAGGHFPYSVRQNIRTLNEYYSVVDGKNTSDAPSDPIEFPGTTRQTFPPYEDDFDPDELDTIEPTWEESTNIDHIIPRKDIYGCACGTNSSANAAVVSGQHNIAMSNRMDDPRRIELLMLFTNYTPPAKVVPEGTGSAADIGAFDAAAADLDAGCSAGGGTTMWSGLLAIGALVLRRRPRSRRSWE